MASSHAPGKTVSPMRITAESITAAVFAGGEGTRIGGAKAMRRLAGRPLIAHVLAALVPRVGRVMIVARTEDDAARLAAAGTAALSGTLAEALPGILAVADRADLAGPVAALMGAVDRVETPFLMTVPVDTPFLPGDLVDRLGACVASGADAAVAADTRCHPTIALFKVAALRQCPPLNSLHATIAPLEPRPVAFPDAGLANINTPAELAAAEARFDAPLTQHGKGG